MQCSVKLNRCDDHDRKASDNALTQSLMSELAIKIAFIINQPSYAFNKRVSAWIFPRYT